jgi:hypothetical protein
MDEEGTFVAARGTVYDGRAHVEDRVPSDRSQAVMYDYFIITMTHSNSVY